MAALKQELDQKNVIATGHRLNDDHIDDFGRFIYSSHLINPIPQDRKHIQLLYSSSDLTDRRAPGGHWVCSYYDKKKLFIYDSLRAPTKRLHEHHRLVLEKLYPHLNLNVKSIVVFPLVDQQPNDKDCGVYAIAFAVTILFGLKPENVRYDSTQMRRHLLEMFESKRIEHFPGQSTDKNIVPTLKVVINRQKQSTKRALSRAKSENRETGSTSATDDYTDGFLTVTSRQKTSRPEDCGKGNNNSKKRGGVVTDTAVAFANTNRFSILNELDENANDSKSTLKQRVNGVNASTSEKKKDGQP
ncbi:uncharacterized protein LOC112495108 [Cephus cinctus]|uniref:Uncharacterized protein LOC112495108 n=1 Tax=Cephus cinctus TaxID=211228 RepID=A0AAJ7RSG3_CEPCN|nr:uncharacterized protein LOC112495108 [Cephus cinctus]